MEKENSKIKVVASASEMSNLVGMFAFLIKDEKIQAKVYIVGKADNTHFIAQIISPLTGEPNIAKLMTIEQLKEWIILPNAEIANEMLEDYHRQGRWRYGVHF